MKKWNSFIALATCINSGTSSFGLCFDIGEVFLFIHVGNFVLIDDYKLKSFLPQKRLSGILNALHVIIKCFMIY